MLFISHSTKDLKEIDQLSKEIGDYGLDTFIAHRDLVPSTDWVMKIIENLHTCPVFIAYITYNFWKSAWCDQESGIAFNLEKKIIPIVAEGTRNPYGFLQKYQKIDGITEKKNDSVNWPKNVAKKVFEALICDSRTKRMARGKLINETGGISNYASANTFVRKLTVLEPFSEREIIRIANLAIDNDQITGAASASAGISGIFTNHITLLNGYSRLDELKKKFRI